MQLPKYENKPFKPPRGLNVSKATQDGATTKRQRTPSFEKATKQKLTSTPLASSTSQSDSKRKRYFTAMYRKPTQKKHKTWTGDGYASFIDSGNFHFYSAAGKSIGTSSFTGDFEMVFDNLFRTAGLEIQLDYEIVEAKETEEVMKTLSKDHEIVPICSSDKVKPSSSIPSGSVTPQLFDKKVVRQFKPLIRASFAQNSVTEKQDPNSKASSNVSRRLYQPVFELSKIENPIVMNKGLNAEVDVIVDPFISKNLRPHQREGVKFMYDCVLGLSRPVQKPSGSQKDLTKHSITLEDDPDIQGCLLADEMGLGKTLMTISLIWTLLKQTPIASKVSYSQSGMPLQGLINKVLIVCPVTLIANWKKEFAKWLNLSRIGILTLSPQNTVEKDKYDVRTFLRVQRTYQVLIIGYEKLLSVSEELEKGKSVLDLLVCDEGHRLKNGTSKVLNVLKSLDIRRKVLLSGTPIQNDLNEFYTVIDFINPGILGSYQHFKKQFIVPISRARDPSNRYNEAIVRKGEEMSQEMIDITQRFVLRRTNSVIESYLPPKTDIILFCKPTKTQLKAFEDILQNCRLNVQFESSKSSLALITLLKKVCNSPSLIRSDLFFNSTLAKAKLFDQYDRALNSGKLKVLMTLLERIKNGTTGEKVVIVSNYTQTLDIIQSLMISAEMRICRMDGSTPNKQRDGIVTSFNQDPQLFALLLSAKSGGVGLNLVGASRLILFDNDWNPSVDLQAMSRIHRDGQKKSCYIYRLVTTGCIDEKILQRQLMKQSLSQKFLSDCKSGEGMADDDLFNKEDLRDLFKVLLDTPSNTHDLICSCDGTGEEVQLQEEEVIALMESHEKQSTGDLGTWISASEALGVINDRDSKMLKERSSIMKRCLVGYKHINPALLTDLLDTVATQTAEKIGNDITFAFVKPS